MSAVVGKVPHDRVGRVRSPKEPLQPPVEGPWGLSESPALDPPVRATLLVPTLNESASIGHVLKSFRAAAQEANTTLFARDPLDWEILVIDGASTDGTGAIAEAEGARVIVEPRPGYGRAYRTGFAAAQGEVIATLDGDATYPAEEVPRFVRMLGDEDLDFITCNRFAHLDRKAMTTEHRIGNWLLNTFVAIFYAHYLRAAGRVVLKDSQSGMWIFRRSVLAQVHLTQDGMPLSEELKLEVILNGLRFREVPIRYAERWGAPKLSSWRDGRKNLTFLFTKRLAVARGRKEIARGNPAPTAAPVRDR
ncbi:MAG: glycosyltransferase family 2 protein [Thermoplasmata archaeon]|nr:glycosyltransferase family 2 protein [Thermoplasmata archaeon]